MQISLVKNSNLYFRANSVQTQTDSRKNSNNTVQTAGAVTTAVGATGAAVSKPFSQFSQLSRMKNQISETTREIKKAQTLITTTGRASNGVWAKFKINCGKFKNQFINFGQKFTNSKFIKPLVESKLYKGVAGVTGGVLAGFVALAGIGDVAGTVVRKADELSN